jgi:DNA-binding NtrC family response regulator
VVNIDLPPLRERIGDICLLAEHFLAKYLDGSNRRIEGFAPETLELMQRYNWPGNVRELENCVERAVVLCRKSIIAPDDLPPSVLQNLSAPGGAMTAPISGTTLATALEAPEKQIILASLQAHNGNRQATADDLGINRTTLYKKMKKYGML